MKAIDIQTMCSSIDFDFTDRFFQIFDWLLWKVVSAAASVFREFLDFFFFIAVFLLDLLVILSIIHIYIKNLPSKKQMRESYLDFIEKPIRWLLIGWLLIGWLLLRRMVIGWLLLYLMFNSSPQVLYQHILICLNRACSIKSVYGLLFDLNKQLGKDWLKQKHEIL